MLPHDELGAGPALVLLHAGIGDLRTLFDGIPMDEMNTSMTINAPAMYLFALYLAVAEEHGTDFGKPLKSIVHPLRADLPIYLAAEGPKNIAMAAELCDGWLAIFYSPHHEDLYKGALAEGFERPNARRGSEEFEVAATVPLIVTDDPESAMDAVRPMYALYFGGMGARSANFHANVPIRMGYEAEVKEIQDLYLSGKKEEAAAAVPSELIEKLTLIGPPDKIRHDLEAWRESSVTTLLIGGDAAMLRQAAELVLG